MSARKRSFFAELQNYVLSSAKKLGFCVDNSMATFQTKAHVMHVFSLFKPEIYLNFLFCRSTYKSFGFTDVFQKSIFYPFLVILVLMFLLQFSGQGAVTFYTALIFEEAESSVDPNDCALVIGVTYFLSSILGNLWFLKET